MKKISPFLFKIFAASFAFFLLIALAAAFPARAAVLPDSCNAEAAFDRVFVEKPELAESALSESAAENATRPVLVLMYHQFLNSRKSKYVVTPATFKNDLATLKVHGYRSVKAQDLIDFVDKKAELPEKPVVITFDDGHFSNHFYATQILKDAGFTAVENVIGRFSQNSVDTESTGNPNYSHLSWDDIAEMDRSGVYEIGNHTYDMHNFKPRFGIGQMQGEPDALYRAALQKDASKLQTTLTEKSGVTPYAFAFPFGKYNDLAKETLFEMGFRVMFTCNEKISTVEQGNPKSLWNIGRYNRDPSFDMDAFLTKRDITFAA